MTKLTVKEERRFKKEIPMIIVTYKMESRNSTVYIAKYCKSKTNEKGRRIMCFHCNKESHYAASCKQKVKCILYIICKKKIILKINTSVGTNMCKKTRQK